MDLFMNPNRAANKQERSAWLCVLTFVIFGGILSALTFLVPFGDGSQEFVADWPDTMDTIIGENIMIPDPVDTEALNLTDLIDGDFGTVDGAVEENHGTNYLPHVFGVGGGLVASILGTLWYRRWKSADTMIVPEQAWAQATKSYEDEDTGSFYDSSSSTCNGKRDVDTSNDKNDSVNVENKLKYRISSAEQTVSKVTSAMFLEPKEKAVRPSENQHASAERIVQTDSLSEDPLVREFPSDDFSEDESGPTNNESSPESSSSSSTTMSCSSRFPSESSDDREAKAEKQRRMKRLRELTVTHQKEDNANAQASYDKRY